MPRYLRLDYDPADGLIDGFIEFAGRAVNLNRMAVHEDLDYSYLWRVFHRGQTPSVAYAKRIATCLQMPYTDFLIALDAISAATAAN